MGFVLFTPLGFYLAISSSAISLGSVFVVVGIFSGLICAFMPCPHCSKPSGVIFKIYFMAVFPMGLCFHCGKSHLFCGDKNGAS